MDATNQPQFTDSHNFKYRGLARRKVAREDDIKSSLYSSADKGGVDYEIGWAAG